MSFVRSYSIAGDFLLVTFIDPAVFRLEILDNVIITATLNRIEVDDDDVDIYFDTDPTGPEDTELDNIVATLENTLTRGEMPPPQ